jgi:CheY-like chemotaxis protein
MATILVAEDEEPIRKLIEIILSTAGHKVLTAANGVEAVAVYRSFTREIDLLITDMNMPVMDGSQVVTLARQTRPDVMIICMTGNTGQPIPDGVGFLVKPFAPDQLKRLVEEVLGGCC